MGAQKSLNEIIMAELINIDHVSKTFGSKQKTVEALKDINIQIEQGSFVCIIGGSGCGKSTLLNILAGFESPSQGAITIGGQPVSKPSAKHQMIFQSYGLLPWRTVLSNIAFAIENTQKELNHKERLAKALRFLNLVGLADFADSYPHQLSGGMKQRVAVARALAAEPDVVFMDEPFGALDAITKMKLQDEIHRICSSEKRTVIMITHDIDEAVYLADRILVMRPAPGRIYKDLNVPLAHPRLRTHPDFVSLRSQLLNALDLATNIEPEYRI